MLTLIVEHFDSISNWSVIEYRHLSSHCNKNGIKLLITNYKESIELAECTEKSIVDIHESLSFDILALADLNGDRSLADDITLQDPNLNIALIIGGMLGEDPPIDREEPLRLIPNIICRTMTNLHLPTDVAGICGIKLLQDKWSISKLEDNLLFPTVFSVSKYEEHFLPFAYFKQSAFDYSLDTMEIIKAEGARVVFGKNLKSEIRNQ